MSRSNFNQEVCVDHHKLKTAAQLERRQKKTQLHPNPVGVEIESNEPKVKVNFGSLDLRLRLLGKAPKQQSFTGKVQRVDSFL